MLDPMDMFRDGGPFMYPILMGALLTPVLLLASGVLSALRIRVPAAFYLLLGSSTLPLGAFGTIMGFRLLEQALLHASAEMYAQLAAMGLQVGLYTLLFGAFVTTVTLACMAAALGLGTALGTKDRMLTPLHAAAGPVLLAGLGFLVVGSIPGGLTALVGSIAIAAVGMFSSTDDEELARLASARATVGTLVVASFVVLGIQLVTNAGITHYAALGRPADVRGEMLEFARTARIYSGGASVGAALAGVLATGMLIAPLARHVLAPRSLISAALAGIVGIAVLAFPGWVAQQTQVLHEETVPASDKRAEVIEALGLDLPTVQSVSLERALVARPTLTLLADGTARFDDAPQQPGPLPPHIEDQGVNLEVSASTRLSRVLEFQLGPARQVDWTVRHPDGLRALRLPPEGQEDAFREVLVDGILAVHTGASIQVAVVEGAERGAPTPIESDALHAYVGDLRARYPEATDLHVWLPEDHTAQDLVDLVDGFIDQAAEQQVEPIWVHWRVDAAPQLTLATLDKAAIRRVMQDNQAQVAYCYERELQHDPSLATRLKIAFDVAPDGTVLGVVAEAPSGNATLDQCVLDRVKRWRFPAFTGESSIRVVWPFVFAPGQRAE